MSPSQSFTYILHLIEIILLLAVAKQKMCKMFSQVNDSSALNKFYLNININTQTFAYSQVQTYNINIFYDILISFNKSSYVYLDLLNFLYAFHLFFVVFARTGIEMQQLFKYI